MIVVTEQQPYEVVGEYPGFELRRYPDHLVAETEVGGAFTVAGNLAFPRLARYIGGHNRSSRSVAMTAPVVQERGTGDRFVVGFVMPADLTPEELPDPSDPSVRTRRVPAQTAAARRFSGWWSRGSYEKQERELLAAVARAGLRVTGQPRFARYDPPWTPWFLRRNEVLVPVEA